MTDQSLDPGARARRRLVAALPKAELHLHLDGSLHMDTALDLARTRGIDAPRDWAGMSAALIAPMPCTSQAELLRAFRCPHRADAGCRGAPADHRRLVATKAAENVRYVEIRWGPRLMSRGPVPRRRHRGRVRGRARGGRRTGIVVRLICTALRSHDAEGNVVLAETAARFLDDGLTGWDLAGPEEAFPDRWSTPGRSRRREPVACASRSTPGSGWRGAGAAGPGRGARTDRPWLADHRRRGVVRGTALAGRDPGPVPHLELAGRDRVVRGGPPPGPTPPCRRPRDAQHGRHHGVRHHADRGVRQRHRADRADPPRVVGHRPPGARCRVRRMTRSSSRCAQRSMRGPPGSPSWPPAPQPAARSSSAAASSVASAAMAVGRSSDGQRLDLVAGGDPGQHEHAAGPDGPGRGEVRADPVADHDRLARVPPDGLRRQLQQVRRGLADGQGRDPGRGFQGGRHAPGSGSQATFGRVDRVAVRGDEPGARPDAIGCRGESQVGQVRVEPGDDRVGRAGGGPAIDALLVHPGGRRGQRSRPPARHRATRVRGRRRPRPARAGRPSRG